VTAEATTRFVVGDGGALLLHRQWRAGQNAPSAFLGHSQPTHSGNLTDLARSLLRSGYNVHSGDLRGHGASHSARQPRGHLDHKAGWDLLIEDYATLTEIAFEGIAWDQRLIVAPNISALLTIELLKRKPDLCRNIVLISPPPNQKTLWMLANAFVKARMMLHNSERPDEHTLYHLYSFLGAQLDNKKHLADVMTPDREIVDQLIADEAAWPTPTLSYWSSIFRGFQRAWHWPDGASVKPGTRILLMYGGEDPMMGLGSFIAPMKAWFAERGIVDLNAFRVEGARSALFLDERRLGISETILTWVGKGVVPHQTQDPLDEGIDDLSSRMVRKFAATGNIKEELSPEELVELCYTAIDDEGRLTEIMYRLAQAIARDSSLNAAQVEQLVNAVMPHWDRSYKISRQVLDNAAIGVVLQNVMERFAIGIVMLSDDGAPVYFNKAYGEALARCMGRDSINSNDQIAPLTADLLRASGHGANALRGMDEAIIIIDERPVGFLFRPSVLRQAGQLRGGPSAVLILRSPNGDSNSERDDRAELMQLAYGLTQQEAIVALKIARGFSPDQAADDLGVSIHTVRTHLKRNYEKIGVQGQTELVARIMAGPVGWL